MRSLLGVLASVASLLGVVYLLFAAAVIGTASIAIWIMFKATFAPCPTFDCLGVPIDAFRLLFFGTITAGILGSVLGHLTFRR